MSTTLLFNKTSKAQNCPALNVIGSFYDLPTNSPPNYATAQASGLCYELHPPYPAQVCFEYMVPFSDTVRATFHLKACGSQSSIGTGTYSAGCSGTASTNATFTGQSTYDNSCNLIANYIAVGYCGGAVSGDIMTVCFDLNTSSACDPITICPMLFCNTSICSTALPIELLSFDAECENNNTLITWITASEINNDYFVLEKSIDGINFYELATIKGAGNSNTQLSYSAIDDEHLPGVGYYRLNQIDFDGQNSYSNTIVKECGSNDFNIYPNPTNGIINITLDNFISNDKVKAIITNAVGKIILEINISQSSTSINIEDIANGYYNIVLIDNTQKRITKKFIKQ